ncbi:MAG: polyamine aminopropyltransferase [Alphaproteobacteria bacterium]|nr:polyamine aminopropyltransferase [Alphaproteobacteria bacterium]
MTGWHEEGLYPDVRTRYKIDRVLYESNTEHQKMRLLEHPRLGKILTLDDVTQTTEKDEFIYHEMMTHVPMLAHGAVRRVLIIGGGDGGILEEVLKHPGVEKATMVEIDAGVVEFSKRYLSEICKGAFEDARTDLVIADGFVFVDECAEKYDVIIVDSTDPEGPGEILFTNEFYRRSKQRLTPGGVLVTQNGVPFMQAGELRSSASHLRQYFGDVSCYLATIPTYVGGAMAMGWATDNAGLRKVSVGTLTARFTPLHLNSRYYTPDVHKAAFALPPYVSELLI